MLNDVVPQYIRIALCQISGIIGVVVESNPVFVKHENVWAVQIRLTTESPSEFVPKETRWVVLVDTAYPDGRIRIYPNKMGGLVHTFPHQDRNSLLSEKYAWWRGGKPCLDSPSQRLGRIAGGPEPFGDMELRLRWHVERCLDWLYHAGNDQLMMSNEPFEVPQCPEELPETGIRVIHDEGSKSWPVWNGRFGFYGDVQCGELPSYERTIVAGKFLDSRGNVIRMCQRHHIQPSKSWIGYWWLWPSPIVISPWCAPSTWAELQQIGAKMNVDVSAFIHWITRRMDGKKNVMILLGYPIPKIWGGESVEIHWQAIRPPEALMLQKTMKGFRSNKFGNNECLKRIVFGSNAKITHLKTLNWHPDRMQARGRFPDKLCLASIAIIGAGALGSSVSEILARSGVTNILIIDHDTLEPGNLVRHTLVGSDLGKNKAMATAARLGSAAPMSKITGHASSLPAKEHLRNLLDPFDIVLDCTGEDGVLRRLSEAWWSIPKRFLSVSFGFAAKRLYLFGSQACTFPFDKFDKAVKLWLVEERSQWQAVGETLEGAGCWSPLFPARCDDVWLGAVTTVKYLERMVQGNWINGLQLMEQSCDDDNLCYRVVKREDFKSSYEIFDEE